MNASAAPSYVGPFYGTVTETFKSYKEDYSEPEHDPQGWSKNVEVYEWSVTHTVVPGTPVDEYGSYPAWSSFSYRHSTTSSFSNGVRRCMTWSDTLSSATGGHEHLITADASTPAGTALFQWSQVNNASFATTVDADAPECGDTVTLTGDDLAFGLLGDELPTFAVDGVVEGDTVSFSQSKTAQDGWIDGVEGSKNYSKYTWNASRTIDMRCDLPCDGQTLQADFTSDWVGTDSYDNRVDFNASDTRGEVVTYSWDFGDGVSQASDHPQVRHPYLEAGEYMVTLTVTSSSGQRSTYADHVVANPIRTYAPEVHFHPEEEWWPTDPGGFVRRSALRWNHDHACPDDVVAPARKIRMARLVSGGYHHTAAATDKCRETRTEYSSRQLTAPARLKDSQKVAPGREGMYLDLIDTYRHGDVPVDATYSNAPALYYDYKPDRYVVYWFFYAMSARKGDNHEGDWERMIVRLQEDTETARSAAYYQHYCDPLDAETTFGLRTWLDMKTEGFLTQETHPEAWSAIAGHPTFPTNVGLDVFPCQASKGFGDRTADGGVTWETWHGELEDASEQPWYGAGVGWGAKIGAGVGWGPLGPGGPMDRSDGPAAPKEWR